MGLGYEFPNYLLANEINAFFAYKSLFPQTLSITRYLHVSQRENNKNLALIHMSLIWSKVKHVFQLKKNLK